MTAWSVTYGTATIQAGTAPTQEEAERIAVNVHDSYVVKGLNPDALAWHVDLQGCDGCGAARYSVSVYDCAGEYHSVEVPGFAAALDRYVVFRAKYPGKVVLVSNLDRCDYDTDGLTEDEQEAIDAVAP